MESYQETVLSAIKLSFFLIENEIDEFPVGAHLLIFLVSYLESLLITDQQTDRPTDRQTDRPIDRQTNRLTD